MHREWFPLKDLIHTGRLCSGGFARQAFPTFIAHIRPSDSLLPCHLAVVIPRFGGTRAPHASSLRGPSPGWLVVRAADGERIGDWLPGLRFTGCFHERDKGLPGAWVVLFVRAMVNHPAGSTSPAHTGFDGVVFKAGVLWTPGVSTFSELYPHGSHTRVPTLRHSRYRDRRKALYRLVRVHLCRAGFAPAGRRFRISRSHRILPSFLTSLAWSHRRVGVGEDAYVGLEGEVSVRRIAIA
jgi:hypothetical protein